MCKGVKKVKMYKTKQKGNTMVQIFFKCKNKPL